VSAAQVAALILGGRGWRLGPADLAVVTAWGAVAGAFLQVLVQVDTSVFAQSNANAQSVLGLLR